MSSQTVGNKATFVMVGGFLGAGKTTAIIRLADYLKTRVCLITDNQSVDLLDTARVRAAGFPVEEITGGCFCCKFDSLVSASATLTRATAPDVWIAAFRPGRPTPTHRMADAAAAV